VGPVIIALALPTPQHGRRFLERVELIERLMAAAKPICCVSVAMGASMGVAWWPLPDYEPGHDPGHIARFARYLEEFRQRLLHATGFDSILVSDASSSIILAWDEYLEWREQYTILNADIGLRVGVEHRDAQRVGARLDVHPMSRTGDAGGRLISNE
jgi:hypothetical protein